MKSNRKAAALASLAAVFVAAFVFAPGWLARPTGSEQLNLATASAVTQYWNSGQAQFPSTLAALVNYWSRYHAIKAIAALLLLVTLALLASTFWAQFKVARRTRLLATAGGFSIALAMCALVLLMANIQGAAAPFSSLLSLLPPNDRNAGFEVAASQIRQQLTGSANVPPPLTTMIDDFARYHAVFAVTSAVVTTVLLAVGAVVWRRPKNSARRVIVSRRCFLALTAAFALLMAVLCVANTMTAARPTPALLSFFDGM